MKIFHSPSHKAIVYLLYFIGMSTSLFGENNVHQHKVLICGVCRNIEPAVNNTINNIEALGSHFNDYKVIIYENNSTDNTNALLAQWAEINPHVILLSETLPAELPIYRTEKIARARNIVLNVVSTLDYEDYEYLIMADLDFQTSWPIQEILETIESPQEWDCVSANGVKWEWGNIYYDCYACRNEICPFGPELMGEDWWNNLWHRQVNGEEWMPVYSAFGGLAIYKTKSILGSSYSGIVTEYLKRYYEEILLSLPSSNEMLQKYLNLRGVSPEENLNDIPIIFCPNKTPWESPNYLIPITVCEHVTLHASMSFNGFRKFYINPKMIIYYKD